MKTKKIIKWAEEKGILKNATPYTQFSKVLEETNEILIAINNDDREELIDAIGDTAITLIILDAMHYPDRVPLKIEYSLDINILGYSRELLLLSVMRTNNKIFEDLMWEGLYPSEKFYKQLHTLNKLASTLDLTLQDCIKSAYKVIKNRKGKMINGTFVKDAE